MSAWYDYFFSSDLTFILLYKYILKSFSKVVQMGHDVGGNFDIHIWACSVDFILTNKWTDNSVLM